MFQTRQHTQELHGRASGLSCSEEVQLTKYTSILVLRITQHLKCQYFFCIYGHSPTAICLTEFAN